jgi:sugar transferase (PEP-CTERM/EpsH1 system associated)
MATLLYLVHRLPYPPDKGDKLRSYHLLKHLSAQHRVFVGAFIDDPADRVHLRSLREQCAGLHVSRLRPRLARLRSLAALVGGTSLTERYYRDRGMAEWVRQTVQDEHIDSAVVFCSSMAQYVEGLPRLRVLVDFVDVDSVKWTQYAEHRAWPLSWLYRCEGRRLLQAERRIAARASRSFFVTDQEAALFKRLAPECGAMVEPLGNGVDAAFYSPDPRRASPFEPGERPLVFTGAMDYWPNVDAVRWFAEAVLPALRAAHPRLRLHIVGRNPAPAVRALAGPAVNVTGTVPDVRPWLQHAAVVVAPLRLARGIQNKVLEAMAMGRPVVASRDCAEPIGAPRDALLAAAHEQDFVSLVDALLRAPERAAAMGRAARALVQQRFSWGAHLSGIDRHLPEPSPARERAA